MDYSPLCLASDTQPGPMEMLYNYPSTYHQHGLDLEFIGHFSSFLIYVLSHMLNKILS